jgi:hypothetical protein
MPEVKNLETDTQVAPPQAATTQVASTLAPTQVTRKRLNLDLAPNSYALLQELSEKTGKNMADVLRTGLALYGIANEAMERGQGIGVIETDRVVKEVLIT